MSVTFPPELDIIVPEAPKFDFIDYITEVIAYSMMIPPQCLSEIEYRNWIEWLIQTGQLGRE